MNKKIFKIIGPIAGLTLIILALIVAGSWTTIKHRLLAKTTPIKPLFGLRIPNPEDDTDTYIKEQLNICYQQPPTGTTRQQCFKNLGQIAANSIPFEKIVSGFQK